MFRSVFGTLLCVAVQGNHNMLGAPTSVSRNWEELNKGLNVEGNFAGGTFPCLCVCLCEVLFVVFSLCFVLISFVLCFVLVCPVLFCFCCFRFCNVFHLVLFSVVYFFFLFWSVCFFIWLVAWLLGCLVAWLCVCQSFHLSPQIFVRSLFRSDYLLARCIWSACSLIALFVCLFANVLLGMCLCVSTYMRLF